MVVEDGWVDPAFVADGTMGPAVVVVELATMLVSRDIFGTVIQRL